ncbi:hypothetical protein BCR37DRAFT_377859 [Protomyces lactucae-debilis]|uniref:Uncharacterized protein n=1 Tax=Protomyces lactucae-debilis TaxID=2754530 RepID=A0A1Y2FLU6_PROLT|nr:uncharacterized protein BCR37DRAFT_377859 [Protomyces lactucae-debilis]ORY84943.1 hypothetical protein BCR37DRAFT_377859 [Protomyces lactucae-debilis]
MLNCNYKHSSQNCCVHHHSAESQRTERTSSMTRILPSDERSRALIVASAGIRSTPTASITFVAPCFLAFLERPKMSWIATRRCATLLLFIGRMWISRILTCVFGWLSCVRAMRCLTLFWLQRRIRGRVKTSVWNT